MDDYDVSQPEKRGKIRKTLGREYFILKRKFRWLFKRNVYASFKMEGDDSFPYLVKTHRSMLLRPLKDVDMYLQHNK